MNSNDPEINEVLNEIRLPQKVKARNCSNYFIFELTQTYFESKAFDEDLKAAKELKKAIFFILYENELVDLNSFKHEKIFKITINSSHKIIRFDESLKSIVKFDNEVNDFLEFVECLICPDVSYFFSLQKNFKILSSKE
jgi:hypothetical protein